MKQTKSKKWTYHKSHSFKSEGKEFSGITQLYQIGVYMIINSNSGMQFSVKPADMVKMEKVFKKDFEKGEITDLEFGIPITVIEDENGFYKEIE